MTHICRQNVRPKFFAQIARRQEFSLANALQKGPVLLAFFSKSAARSAIYVSLIERLHQRYKSANLTIVGISQNGPEKTAAFNKEYGVTFPFLLDEERKAYVRVQRLPAHHGPHAILRHERLRPRQCSMGFVKADIESIANQFPTRKNLQSSASSFPRTRPCRRPG